MRAMAAAAALAGLGLAGGLALAAGPQQYQFTGTVTDVDLKGRTIKVDKGGDAWEFSTEGLKGLKVKKGDRVTVHYTMTARKVEPK
jgi:hypothetical protein